jgi:hypothetical protein
VIQVTHTFGYTPLQQYLVPFDGGRLQCLPIAWDTERGKWFHLGDTVYAGQDIKPDNWLYWTNQAQNWNGMCADCHTTNLKKNYDPEAKTFNTTWSEIDVSCEACQSCPSITGQTPEGSRPADVNTGLIVRTRDLDNRIAEVRRCHSRRSCDLRMTQDLLNYMIPAADPSQSTMPMADPDVRLWYGSFTRAECLKRRSAVTADSFSKGADNQHLRCHVRIL